MYGETYELITNEVRLMLRAPTLPEVKALAPDFSKSNVQKFLSRNQGFTEFDEEEWFHKTRKDDSCFSWGIVPEGENSPIGFVGIHGITNVSGSCTGGIVIAKQEFWNKGIASAVHLAGLLIAFNKFNRGQIKISIAAENKYSLAAALKTGYLETGKDYRDWTLTKGGFSDVVYLASFNPAWASIYWPEGPPENIRSNMEVVNSKLEIARNIVKQI